jgi:hypothetical protein
MANHAHSNVIPDVQFITNDQTPVKIINVLGYKKLFHLNLNLIAVE